MNQSEPGPGDFPLVLIEVLANGWTLDRAVSAALREHRDWDLDARGEFVEILQTLVRRWRAAWAAAGFGDADFLSPTALTQARVRKVVTVFLQKGGRVFGKTFPDWMEDAIAAELGTTWPATRKALDERAPLFVRVNPLRASFEWVLGALTDSRPEPVPGHPHTLVLRGRRDVFATQAFREGWFEVQDISSQQVAPFLDVKPGMRVLDACAGAGGKSLHLAAIMKNKGRIVALDTAEWKLRELRRRAARAGVDNVEARIVGDARALKRLRNTADRVLLDVPCSGLGVARRNPDIKWKLTAKDLDRLRATQAQLLDEYSPAVKPGGKLVYATCSILPSEGEAQVRSFLDRTPGWKMDASRRIAPGQDGGDGFFMARLERLTTSQTNVETSS